MDTAQILVELSAALLFGGVLFNFAMLLGEDAGCKPIALIIYFVGLIITYKINSEMLIDYNLLHIVLFGVAAATIIRLIVKLGNKIDNI